MKNRENASSWNIFLYLILLFLFCKKCTKTKKLTKIHDTSKTWLKNENWKHFPQIQFQRWIASAVNGSPSLKYRACARIVTKQHEILRQQRIKIIKSVMCRLKGSRNGDQRTSTLRSVQKCLRSENFSNPNAFVVKFNNDECLPSRVLDTEFRKINKECFH